MYIYISYIYIYISLISKFSREPLGQKSPPHLLIGFP